MWRTHWKRPWCWERLKAGGEEDDIGRDGWMASLTQWTWVWTSSWSWWWTVEAVVLQSVWLQRVRQDWATELNWTGVRWYLIVVVIWISLVNNEIEHSSMYLLVICLSLWESVYSCPLPIFNQLVWFCMLLSCKSYLYILYINPLSEISFANIFS